MCSVSCDTGNCNCRGIFSGLSVVCTEAGDNRSYGCSSFTQWRWHWSIHGCHVGFRIYYLNCNMLIRDLVTMICKLSVNIISVSVGLCWQRSCVGSKLKMKSEKFTLQNLYYMALKYSCHLMFHYTFCRRSWGGYTGFTLSIHLSVHL